MNSLVDAGLKPMELDWDVEWIVNEDGSITFWMVEDAMENLECLDGHKGGCSGPVEYRAPMSPTGTWFPRCDKHFEERWEKQKQIVSRYGGQHFYY